MLKPNLFILALSPSLLFGVWGSPGARGGSTSGGVRGGMSPRGARGYNPPTNQRVKKQNDRGYRDGHKEGSHQPRSHCKQP